MYRVKLDSFKMILIIQNGVIKTGEFRAMYQQIGLVVSKNIFQEVLCERLVYPDDTITSESFRNRKIVSTFISLVILWGMEFCGAYTCT